MKKILHSLLYVILVVCVSSCTNNKNNNSEDLFLELYSKCETNPSLKLSFQKIDYGGNSNIDIYIENSSVDDFVFSYKSDFKMWSFDSPTWKEVTSGVQINNLGADKLTVRSNGFKVIPSYPTSVANGTIRMAITGYWYKDGIQKEKCNVVYADYKVTP